jgi:hypothetical protein
MNGALYSEEGSLGQGDADKHSTKQSQFDQPIKNPVFADSAWADGWPMANDTLARDLLGRQRSTKHGREVLHCSPRVDSASPSAAVPAGASLPGRLHMAFVDGPGDGVRLNDL